MDFLRRLLTYRGTFTIILLVVPPISVRGAVLFTTTFGSLASEFSSLQRSVADLTFGRTNLT